MDTRKIKLLSAVKTLKRDYRKMEKRTAKQADLKDLREKREQLSVARNQMNFDEMDNLVTKALKFADQLFDTLEEVSTAVDEIAEKTSIVLSEITSVLNDTYDSLLRRTIAINIEYEFKDQLLLLDSSRTYDVDDILSTTSITAMEIARKANVTEANKIFKSWFGADRKLFLETMQLMKVASLTVHPTRMQDGGRVGLAAAEKSIKADFEVPIDSYLFKKGYVWDEKHKEEAIKYLDKLKEIRQSQGDNTLLHA